MNEVLKAIQERRSVRSYQEKQVPEAVLAQILEAGAWAPSGKGSQPVRLVVIQDAQTRQTLSRMNAAIQGSTGDPFYGAPTVVVVLADSSRSTCVQDGSLVLGNLLLAAHCLGLGACWINRAREEFDSPEGQAMLRQWGIPAGYVGVGHCILGYPAGEPAAPKPRRTDFVLRV